MTPGVRLILAIHDHQPVGNFDGVFEASYRDAYRPFLDVMGDYPEIPFALHTSGPLMEWLVERRPEYVERLRGMVDAGRVEILGGGYYEPILTMLPARDRVGQIRSYSAYLEGIFGRKVRGMWVPERVWEQSIASSIADAGIEYTVLDDFHFRGAGVPDRALRGYFLTEDGGRIVKVFPGSERLRYLMPFREPHATYEFLREVAAERPGSTVVFADDGEKFGAWPGTSGHVYRDGWLRRFCDMIVGNRGWLRASTFAEAVDESLPAGSASLPDSSYREMTEWALPAGALADFEARVAASEGDATYERLKDYVRAGGSWRNFKAKYAEAGEMYARMLGVSDRLHAAEAAVGADHPGIGRARRHLHRGQCNCPYWHGAFGGLYLPHLRNAIYANLIAADEAIDEAEGRAGPRASVDVGDFNLDARAEARLRNDRIDAFVRPATGGHVYELDIRHARTNLLATLDRRPEAYHAKVARAARGGAGHAPGDEGDGSRGPVVLKQSGLDRLLVYDRHPRKALVDHVYPVDLTLDDLTSGREVERGDFATGAYLSRVRRSAGRAAILMERAGVADGHAIRVRKSIAIEAGSPTLEVAYEVEGLPEGAAIRFAVEVNHAAMAGRADDRYYAGADGRRLGRLDARLDLADAAEIRLADEWLDLASTLRFSPPAGLWCHPIETVSQSEGGFEGVYQSSAVVAHWLVVGDASGRWRAALSWTIDRAHAPADGAAGVEAGAEIAAQIGGAAVDE